MSEREKGSILEALSKLPNDDKQFVLGYAAGRSASQEEADQESTEEDGKDGAENGDA